MNDNQSATTPPKKNGRGKKATYRTPNKQGKWCEVCGELDPHVLDSHHLSPRNHNLGEEFDAIDITIMLCASCHAKCHRMYGGQKRPYVGPLTKDELVVVIRRERKRYKKFAYSGEDLSEVIRKRSDRISSDRRTRLFDCVNRAYKKSGMTVNDLSVLYHLSGEEIRKIIKKGRKYIYAP